MSDVRKIPLSKCIDIHTGISCINTNEILSPKTMYKIGRLNDHVRSPAKIFERISTQKGNELNDRIKIVQERSKSESGDKKFSSQEEIILMRNALVNEINALLQTEEEVMVPELKLSEFVASEDNATKNIKKGQSLVPQQFFTLLGDIIMED